MPGNSELSGAQDWCGFSGEFDLGNPAFQQILMFYLFECPVEHTSARSILLEEFGWPSPYNKLTKTLKKYCQGKGINYYPVSTLDEMMDTLCAEDLYYKLYIEKQTVVFYEGKKGKAKQLLKYIRNAFAHGSFEIKSTEADIIYILESREPNSEEIRARMIINERALLDMISIVQAGPQ